MRPQRFSGLSQVPTRPTQGVGDGRAHADGWTREKFLRRTAGAAAIGVAASAGLVRPGRALAGPGIGLADPIPTTFEFFPGSGVQSHIEAPPFLVGPDSDPATVFNFQGVSGVAYISGTCEQRNMKTGETRELPFASNDMRFMKGVFRGHDGHVRDATFGFV